MKVRIFDETVPVPEKEIILRLIPSRCSIGSVMVDEIAVAVVDEEGNRVRCGQLVAFTPDMKLIRRHCVNGELGLPLDSTGRLQERAD
ncbi:hypothetical protein LCGC14_1108800 [marine sediment metagenome]|uniref:Uncharacterized protein n=1 Tax=marine sediment metagenome TaxID=412755 RepID=A0A0F9QDP1_9ZZZZ